MAYCGQSFRPLRYASHMSNDICCDSSPNGPKLSNTQLLQGYETKYTVRVGRFTNISDKGSLVYVNCDILQNLVPIIQATTLHPLQPGILPLKEHNSEVFRLWKLCNQILAFCDYVGVPSYGCFQENLQV